MVQRNSSERAEMLAARREEQRRRQPGFTPMSNKRINRMMQERLLVLTSEDIEFRATMGTGGEPDVRALQEQAVRDVAKKLPPAGRSKLFVRRPSKSDSPAYRGVGGAGPVRQAELAK